jgi:diacylglycerol kinase (ATP)
MLMRMQRLLSAFQNSSRALTRAYQTEPAIRQEIILLFIAVPITFVITDEGWRRAELIGMLLFVLAVELLNTAIEKLCDRLHAERHDSIGYVKDLGSAAVLMSLLLAGFMWAVALWQFADRYI